MVRPRPVPCSFVVVMVQKTDLRFPELCRCRYLLHPCRCLFKSGTCRVRIIFFPWLKMRESVPFFSIELMELSTRFMITLRIFFAVQGPIGEGAR
ncbi:MAG: hypothetical protein Ct9H300mP28_28490 [Pseudomonadota bacterium]|nr:MAG: hypothetical protein Ct9H300mP28_28490 [Pseudomonadota bacterium]